MLSSTRPMGLTVSTAVTWGQALVSPCVNCRLDQVFKHTCCRAEMAARSFALGFCRGPHSYLHSPHSKQPAQQALSCSVNSMCS